MDPIQRRVERLERALGGDPDVVVWGEPHRNPATDARALRDLVSWISAGYAATAVPERDPRAEVSRPREMLRMGREVLAGPVVEQLIEKGREPRGVTVGELTAALRVQSWMDRDENRLPASYVDAPESRAEAELLARLEAAYAIPDDLPAPWAELLAQLEAAVETVAERERAVAHLQPPPPPDPTHV